MRVAPRPLRHWLAAPLFVSLLALALTADATTAHTYSPPFMQGGFAQLDVFERADGVALPVYGKDGQRFVVEKQG